MKIDSISSEQYLKENQVSPLEQKFDALWTLLFPDIDLEAEVSGLIPGRKFRFDYYHPESRIAIEVNGGIFGSKNWATGETRPMGHNSASGIKRDYEKVNLAIREKIYVFMLSSEMINEKWLTLIAEEIKERQSPGVIQ